MLQIGVLVKINNRMANSVVVDGTAVSSDLYCLQGYMYWSAGMKGLTHLYLVDSSTQIFEKVHFHVKKCLLYCRTCL